MTIAKHPIVVSADNWETIKSTFMLIANSVDSEQVDEICEDAIAQMEQLQGTIPDEPGTPDLCEQCGGEGSQLIGDYEIPCMVCGGSGYVVEDSQH